MGLVLESLGQFGQLRRSPGHTTSAQCSPLQHSHTQYGCSGQASCPAVPQASRCQPGSLLPATVPLSKRQARHILRASPGDGESAFNRTAEKALEINLNPLWYGSFAEIGAGQEVARWFFRVGAAAGTIAKSVSAYDMTISDAMYGAANRYVTRERVEAMLDYEYLQCNLTLRKQRGSNTAFFAFSDTVVAKAFGRQNECHGWLGLKYQSKPGGPANSVMLHTRMLDSTAQAQQEALGVLGVNLIHGVLTKGSNFGDIIDGLMHDLSRGRIEVDLIDFSGPEFSAMDNRLAALRLVQRGLCDAALFDSQGTPQIPMEAFRKKNVLLTRGRFQPFTSLHNDMLSGAASQFFCEPAKDKDPDECVFRDDTLVLLEMTTRDMMEGGDLLDWTSNAGINEAGFLQRIEALSQLGYSVLLSNFKRYFKVAAYLGRFTRETVVIAMGIPSLKNLFDEMYYSDLDGGILEAFGRLLKHNVRIYVYPALDNSTGELVSAETLQVDPSVQKLYDYIVARGTIIPIQDYNADMLSRGDVSKRVQESIRMGTKEWEELVPHSVSSQIKLRGLLGYRAPGTNGHVNGNGSTANGNGNVMAEYRSKLGASSQ